jgi:hypothetical protein
MLVGRGDPYCQPAQEHNLEKLRAALLAERHLFVLLPGFTTAPFTASEMLMRAKRRCQTKAQGSRPESPTSGS